MSDKKINISQELYRKLDLVCFFNQVSKKQFIEQLIKQYLKEKPLPKKLILDQKSNRYLVIK